MVHTMTLLLGMVGVGWPGHCVEAKAQEADGEDTVGERQHPGGGHLCQSCLNSGALRSGKQGKGVSTHLEQAGLC